MDFQKIIQDIQNRVYYPVYCLMGKEPYFIDVISDLIENTVLEEHEQAFDQQVLYGKDIDIPNLISLAKQFPMNPGHRVIIVKEAQDLKKIETLTPYIENPQPSTILVLCHKYKTLDKRKALAKAINKKGVLYTSQEIYENQVAGWIMRYTKEKGYQIGPKASQMLVESLGQSLSKITNELGKLFINIPDGSEITSEIIEENIGISKDFNVFELQKALGKRDVLRSNQIIHYFAANEKENPMAKVAVFLFQYFQKVLMVHYINDKSKFNLAAGLGVNPHFVDDYAIAARNYSKNKCKHILVQIHNFDMKGKGVNNSSAGSGELLKELIFRILH